MADQTKPWKTSVGHFFKVLMGLLYIAAGLNHFWNTDIYVNIMPPYLPWPLELVYISGVFEVLGGLGLLIPRVSVMAAWGIIALLVAVFPANIQMALHPEVTPQLSTLMVWLRLPLQGLLIYWAYLYTRPARASE